MEVVKGWHKGREQATSQRWHPGGLEDEVRRESQDSETWSVVSWTSLWWSGQVEARLEGFEKEMGKKVRKETIILRTLSIKRNRKLGL